MINKSNYNYNYNFLINKFQKFKLFKITNQIINVLHIIIKFLIIQSSYNYYLLHCRRWNILNRDKKTRFKVNILKLMKVLLSDDD
jgi:hypothetical protein